MLLSFLFTSTTSTSKHTHTDTQTQTQDKAMKIEFHLFHRIIIKHLSVLDFYGETHHSSISS